MGRSGEAVSSMWSGAEYQPVSSLDERTSQGSELYC